MSSELKTTEQRNLTTQEWLENAKFRNALTEASPRDYNSLALARAVITMVKNDDKLARCTTQSLLNAVLISAQTGLLPGQIGMCALVPYGNNCQWQLMFKGAVTLASRSGAFGAISCEVVYEGDFFDYNEGTDAYVSFKRNLKESERGERVAAFCSITPKDGGKPSIRIMGIEAIYNIRDKFDKGSRSDRPWLIHFDEMACKTVMKRCLKRLPMSTELALAIGMDDLAESGLDQQPTGPSMDDLPATPTEGFCNKDLADGLVCSLQKGHEGDCSP